MTLISGINRFIGLFVDSLRQIGRVRIWLMLIGYFVVTWFVLYMHYAFTSPVFYGLVSGWTALFGQQEATGFSHYPGHFLMLPYFFGWAKFFIGLVLEGLVLGVVARQFFIGFAGADNNPGFPSRSILASWGHLIMGWLLLNGLILLISFKLPQIVAPLIQYSPRREMLFEFAVMPFIYVLIFALFFTVIPMLSLYRINVFIAAKRSLLVFFRNPLTCLFLSGFIMLGPIVISFVTSRPAQIVDKLRPELVYWVLIIALVVDVIANFLWMGTAVRLIIDEEE
jgi:hypothetical protein